MIYTSEDLAREALRVTVRAVVRCALALAGPVVLFCIMCTDAVRVFGLGAAWVFLSACWIVACCAPIGRRREDGIEIDRRLHR